METIQLSRNLADISLLTRLSAVFHNTLHNTVAPVYKYFYYYYYAKKTHTLATKLVNYSR